MGTDAHLIVVGGAPRLVDLAVARVRDLERRWSRFRPDSEISRANGRAGEWTTVSPETVALVERAELARRRTGGRFDPTLLHDVVAAGYDRSFDELAGSPTGPDDDTPRPMPLESTGKSGGPVLVDRAASAILVPRGVGFDPGGMGKGFAADLVVGELLGEAAGGACVNLGGDVRVAGVGPDGGDWIISVDDPRDPGESTVAELHLADGAVATSSRCRRRWARTDGTPAHHLIDPSTHRPAETPTLAATVVASEAWVAEALAKIAFLVAPTTFVVELTRAGATGLVVTEHGVLRAPELGRFTRCVAAPTG